MDITQDGTGIGNYDRLDNLFINFENEFNTSNKDPNLKVKVTKNKNNWKSEFIIYNGANRIFRLKFYNKTLEKLTSLGVKHNEPSDPLS